MSVGVLLTIAPGDLLIGSTTLLGIGALVVRLAAAPVHRQRAAELAVAATLLWLVLALIPLPRWPRTSTAEVAVPTSGSVQPVGSTRYASHPVPAPNDPRNAVRQGVNDTRRVSLMGLLLLAYGAGSALIVAYLLLGAVLVHRLLVLSTHPPSWLEVLFAARCRALGVKRARLGVANRPCRPFLIGIIRPAVVIPRALADPEREADLCRILDHELIHLKRGDVLSRILFALAMPVLWPNPLFWYLRARAALSAELIADDAAADAADRRVYARALLTLSEELHSLPAPGIVPGSFRNRSELTRRIEMLTSNHTRLAMSCTPKLRVVQATVTLLTVGACAALFGARSLPAQESVVRADEIDRSAVRANAAQPERTSSSTISRRPEPEPPRARVAAVSSSDSRDTERVVGSTSRSVPPMSREHDRPEQTAQGQELDPAYAATLALVDRALTLRNNVEMARAELAQAEQRFAAGALDTLLLKQTQLTLQSLQRRFDAVLILVQSEIAATRIELSHFEEALKVGSAEPVIRAQIVRLTARIKVLETAL